MSITVISGPVKAGKSKKLIEIYNQLEDCGVMVFSSKFSLTDGEKIVSRYGTKIKAIPINSLFDIPCHIHSKYTKYILVDEFQFLQMSTNELKAFFDKYGFQYDFYLFGISDDYTRRPFELIAHAMAMADDIQLLGGYCDICGTVPSRYSLRLENGKPANIKDEAPIIMLDGEHNDVEISYQSVCKECYRKIYYSE